MSGKADGQAQRFLVAWDFSKKPSGMLYRVLRDEFGTSHPRGDYELVTQTKKLPKRQGYGLNDLTFILTDEIVHRNENAVSVLATSIHPLSADEIRRHADNKAR